MNRRSFIRAVVALPLSVSLPSLALTSKPSAYSGLFYLDGWIFVQGTQKPLIYATVNNPMSWDVSDNLFPT